MPAAERLRMRHPVPGARGGGLYVSGLQRSRLLDATFALVGEDGYQRLTVRKVAERAGISSKTFYDLFSDREDCFLAAFDYAIAELTTVGEGAWSDQGEWTARVRAGLGALLELLDREPALRRLVFVEALSAGPRVLERRAQVLDQLATLVDEGRQGKPALKDLPPLTAAGIVGGAVSLIHAQLLQPDQGSLSELLSSLMASIVLPYRGREVAARELARPTPKTTTLTDRGKDGLPVRPLGSVAPLDFRLTVRTQAALVAVGERPGVNNREISERMKVADQGQISRLMGRLQEQGLVENAGVGGQGAPKAWHLTPEGEHIIQANPPMGPVRKNTSPAKHNTPLASPPAEARAANGFRLTARTHLVLTAVREHAGATNREIASASGVGDQGQISKLLARLEDRGLIQNTGGITRGASNAWRLTQRGEEIVSLSLDRGALPSVTEEETCPQ